MSKQESGIDLLVKPFRPSDIEALANSHDPIKSAHLEASAIIDAAHKKAAQIIADATQKSVDDQRKISQELEMAARDFSLKFSERLKEQFFFPVIRESVRATLKEPNFLREVLGRLIVAFVRDSKSSIDVLVSKELKTTLAAFFAGGAFDQLDKNADFRLIDEEGLEGFVLIRRGEHFVWDFRVDTIAKELTRLVEPSLRKYFSAAKKGAPDAKSAVGHANHVEQ